MVERIRLEELVTEECEVSEKAIELMNEYENFEVLACWACSDFQIVSISDGEREVIFVCGREGAKAEYFGKYLNIEKIERVKGIRYFFSWYPMIKDYVVAEIVGSKLRVLKPRKEAEMNG